jgi:hypothetical protein
MLKGGDMRLARVRVALVIAMALLVAYGCGSVTVVKIANFQGFDAAAGSTKNCKSLCPVKNSSLSDPAKKNLCEVCLAREFTGTRADAYTGNIYDTYNATTGLDFGLIGVATATVAAALYKANQGTIIGIPLGGALLGGLRTYINNGAKYDLYASAVSALSCIQYKSNAYNTKAGHYDNAVSAETGINSAVKGIKTALENNKLSGLSEADLKSAEETGEQALTSADTAVRLHEGFAEYIIDTTKATENKVFTHLKGLRPNIDQITSAIKAQQKTQAGAEETAREAAQKTQTIKLLAANVREAPENKDAAKLKKDMETIADKNKEVAGYLSEITQLRDDVQACMTGL